MIRYILILLLFISCSIDDECTECRVIGESNRNHICGFAGPEFRIVEQGQWLETCDPDVFISTSESQDILNDTECGDYIFRTYAECK